MEKTPSKFIWHYAKIFRWYFFWTVIFLACITVSGRVAPLYMAKVYDAVSIGPSNNEDYYHDITLLILTAVGLNMIRVVFNNLSVLLDSRAYPKVNSIVTRDVFDYANKHSIAYFTEEMSGNISNKVQQLSHNTQLFIENILSVIHVTFVIIVSFVLLGSVSTYFLLPMAVWSILMVMVGRYFGKKRYLYAKELGQVESITSGKIVDSLSNYSEIKSFANFKFERLNLNKQLKKLRQAEIKERTVQAIGGGIQESLVMASLLLFLFFEIYLLKQGKIDAVGFIFAATIFTMMSWTVFEINRTTHRLAHIFGRLQAALDTIAVDPEIQDKKDAVKLVIQKAKIDFEKINFSYKGKTDLFHDLNVHIEMGEKIGLVGHSGSGKSTFIKLLARYYDVEDGTIKINDIDIRDITQDSLRKHISTIPQDVNLFNRTLMENIRYGRTNASDEDVYKAAKKAFADDFIKNLPNKYDTKVGERGVVLSGGERQRIAIARAILKDAPILIFDEATSALDSKSEKHIQKSMSALMKNKTVIAIAHRLSTLREMDRILVFEKGKIVEQGSHLALLRKKGIYYKLYNMQSDGLLGGIEGEAEQSRNL